MPEPWQEKLTPFDKLALLKALRSDKVVQAVQNWITMKMGKKFVEPPTLDISKCFNDSNVSTPLIFVLSTGSDPTSDFQRFADDIGMGNKYENISLGQGQGERAAKMVRDATNRGGWVLL